MKNLTRLDLRKNELRGEIPLWMDETLTQLAFVDFATNKLEGSMPGSIFTMPSLSSFDCSDNDLTGVFPWTPMLSPLEKLNAGENDFEGEVDWDSLASLAPTLKELFLSSNELEGTLGESLGKLTALKFLDLAGNQLSGVIPTSIGSCTALQQLGLAYNLLSGSVPSELGDLSGLAILFLTDNFLSGQIPSELGLLKLRKLWIRFLDIAARLRPNIVYRLISFMLQSKPNFPATASQVILIFSALVLIACRNSQLTVLLSVIAAHNAIVFERAKISLGIAVSYGTVHSKINF